MSVLRGLLAGAAGAIALDLVTYGDMAWRARPPSELPSLVVARLAEKLGLTALTNDDETTRYRRNGLGALLGYTNGLAAGVLYAALRPHVRSIPRPIAALALGAATLVASEGLATKLGAADWSTWSAADWLADIVPRTVYGLIVVGVYDALA